MMSADEDWLVDSNIFLRMSRRADPNYSIIRAALVALRTESSRLCYTSQILGEFWNVSTRPSDKNGFGLTIAKTDVIVREIERDFEFLPDNQTIHNRWRSLLVQHDVKGVQVHDARLAASMYVHGVLNLLTINTRDFQRFPGLTIVHPAEVTAIRG